jgi:hypothetical protein
MFVRNSTGGDVMIRIIAACCLLILGSSGVSAEVPEFDLCTVTPCDDFLGMVIYPQPIPGGAAEFTVQARNMYGTPIPNAFVEVNFEIPTNHTFCSDATMAGTTDANGEVTLAISGGGCTIDAYAVSIRVNGVTIRQYQSVKSPDYAPGSNGNVELGDFIYFGTRMASGSAGCTDYYNAGVTGLGAFIVFGEAWTRACP